MNERNPSDLVQLFTEIDSFLLERAENKWKDVTIIGDPETDYQERRFEIRKGEVKFDLFVGPALTKLRWAGEPPEEFVPGGGEPQSRKHFKLRNTITHTLPSKLFPDGLKSEHDYKRLYNAFTKLDLKFVQGKNTNTITYLLNDDDRRVRLALDFMSDSLHLESMVVTGSQAPRDDFGYVLGINYDWGSQDKSHPNMYLNILNTKKDAWNPDALEWVLGTARMKETIGDLHESAEELSRKILPKIEERTRTI